MFYNVSWHGRDCFDEQHDAVQQTSCSAVMPGKTVKSHSAQLDTSISKIFPESIESPGDAHPMKTKCYCMLQTLSLNSAAHSA